MYIITDGNSYIGWIDGKYAIVENKNDAFKWKRKEKSDSFLKHLRISKKIIKNYGSYKKYKVMEERKETMKNKIELDLNILDEIKRITDITKQLENRKKYLSNLLSLIDNKDIDMKHEIEFAKVNAYEGYKLFKNYHDLLNKRREVKNELETIGYFNGTKLTVDSLEQLRKTYDGIYNNKKYSQRTNVELSDLVK